MFIKFLVYTLFSPLTVCGEFVDGFSPFFKFIQRREEETVTLWVKVETGKVKFLMLLSPLFLVIYPGSIRIYGLMFVHLATGTVHLQSVDR